MCIVFFFQAEDGIRDLVRSRGLGDVYKRQERELALAVGGIRAVERVVVVVQHIDAGVRHQREEHLSLIHI
mgnify:CR=1 FL=1